MSLELAAKGTRAQDLLNGDAAPAPDSQQQICPGGERLQGCVPKWPEVSVSTEQSPKGEKKEPPSMAL